MPFPAVHDSGPAWFDNGLDGSSRRREPGVFLVLSGQISSRGTVIAWRNKILANCPRHRGLRLQSRELFADASRNDDHQQTERRVSVLGPMRLCHARRHLCNAHELGHTSSQLGVRPRGHDAMRCLPQPYLLWNGSISAGRLGRR